MARPPKYNADVHKAIIDNLKLGCSRTTAAELSGITRETMSNWEQRYPKFLYDVDTAIAGCKRSASATIRQAILKGDVQSAFRYLALQERREWAETKHIDLTVQVREKAEKIAAELGVSVDTVMAEAEAVAAGTWDAWSP